MAQYHPNEVAIWLYFTVSAFSGRDGKSICGGGEDDIHNLVIAASGKNELGEGRKVKKKLRERLRRAWLENDHATIYDVAAGYERGASMKKVDYANIVWVNLSPSF